MLARVERPPGGLDRRHALRLEQEAQLAVDGRDALDPGHLRQLGGHGLDGAVEIIHDRQDLAQQQFVGQPEQLLALLLRAAPVVLEVGRGALPAGEVVAGLLSRGGQLRLQLRDALQQLGRGGRPEGLDALLGAGLVRAHAYR